MTGPMGLLAFLVYISGCWLVSFKCVPMVTGALRGAPQSMLILLAGVAHAGGVFLMSDRWADTAGVYLTAQFIAGMVMAVSFVIVFVDGMPWRQLPSWAPARIPLATVGPAVTAATVERPSRVRRAIDWLNGSVLRRLYVRAVGGLAVAVALEWRLHEVEWVDVVVLTLMVVCGARWAARRRKHTGRTP